MKKINFLKIIGVTVLFACFSQQSHAQDKKFGVGGVINGPNGISVKAWISEDMAIGGAISFSIDDQWGFFQIHADFLKHKLFNQDSDTGDFHIYYGGGLRYFTSDSFDEIGIRLPVGVSYVFKDLPFDLFLETAPVVVVDPRFYTEFEGGAGFRFYFGK